MTNANSTFDEWFREVERLAVTMGFGVLSDKLRDETDKAYENGMTPHDFLADIANDYIDGLR